MAARVVSCDVCNKNETDSQVVFFFQNTYIPDIKINRPFVLIPPSILFALYTQTSEN